MIRAINVNATTKLLKKFKAHLILSVFVMVFIMFFATFFIVIAKNNITMAKSRTITELQKKNKQLDGDLNDKLYKFKRLSSSKEMRTKAIALNMISPKEQYNIVYITDSEKKKEVGLRSVFASLSSVFNINETTSAKDDIH